MALQEAAHVIAPERKAGFLEKVALFRIVAEGRIDGRLDGLAGRLAIRPLLVKEDVGRVGYVDAAEGLLEGGAEGVGSDVLTVVVPPGSTITW